MPTFAKITCPQLDTAKRGLQKLASTTSEKGAVQAVARGLLAWGERTRTSKIIPRTPKDFGNLRDTITVKVTSNGAKATLTIYAGGPAAPYAATVHEKMDVNIHWQTPGTGPKYIETPVNEEMPKLPGEVARETDKAIERAWKK
jgi:hypothetical protein